MIKYLGSKRVLIPDLLEQIKGDDVKTIVDVFSGTSRVGHALKKNGYRVIANDLSAYAKVLADCYVVADKSTHEKEAKEVIEDLNQSDQTKDGFFTKSFCVDAKFFQPKNGRRIDWMRDRIDELSLTPLLKSIVLTSLMEAADRVDSTCGLQMAYLKDWAKRSHNDIHLRIPDLVDESRYGDCEAYQLDAKDFVKKVSGDVAYLDPPYNQHSYLGNYHIWETLVLWDEPQLYGKANKRIDVKSKKSPFNRKAQALNAFAEVVRNVDVKKIVVSFSDEGFISKSEMEDLLSERGKVLTITKDYKRYVGAQIGIHNQQGRKVGQVSHLKNKEYIYVVEEG